MTPRLVIEWTRASLRVAVATGGEGRYRLQAIHAQAIGAGEAAAALRQFLTTTKTGAEPAISVIPRELVITRVVKFPATDVAELEQMVELYARAQLPYPREQTVMDFHVLSQAEGFTTVTIVACQREVVERHLTVLREAGAPTGIVTVSAWGVWSWYRQACLRRDVERIHGGGGAIEEPVLIVNVDDVRTDLVLIQEQRVLSSRSVGQGILDWPSGADIAELLAAEVERTRATIRKELPTAEAKSVLLTGLGELTQWREQLAQRLALPVAVLESTQPLGRGPFPLAAPVSPVVVGGLAHASDTALLNLSPTEVRQQLRHRRQVRELVRVSGLVAAAFVLAAVWLGVFVFQQQRLADRLAAVLSQAEPEAKRIQEQLRSTEVVDAVLNERVRLLELLAAVFQRTPGTVALEGLILEQARHELVLRGEADSVQSVLGYVAVLEGLPGVEGVDLRYTTQRAGASGERTEFEVVMHRAASAEAAGRPS